MATALTAPAIALLSAFAAYTSITSIQNVRLYEERTKQAAKWSNTAEEQLNKTYSTETAGAVAGILSLGTSLYLSIYPGASKMRLVVDATNVAAAWFAADHISRFWHGKIKVPVPGLGAYNDAIGKMDALTRMLFFLAIAWAADAGVGLFELAGLRVVNGHEA